jgi:hypothetical protein
LFVAPAGINFALTTSMVHTAQSGRVAPQMPKGESSSGRAPSSNRFFTMSACGGLPGPLKDRQCGCLGILEVPTCRSNQILGHAPTCHPYPYPYP